MKEISEEILEIAQKDEPTIWWREYPPRFLIRNKSLKESLIRYYLEKVFREGNQKIGVYVHIPFCQTRCLFCRYYLMTKKNDEEVNHYLESLNQELHLYRIDFNRIKIDSLYVGGGTPTLLNQAQLIKLFQIINRFFKFKKSAQILIEGTPDTLEYKKLCLLKKLGINRLTIGVQSFDDKVLRKSARPHSARDVYQAFNNARKAEIENINFDIILGLPGEIAITYHNIIKGIKDLKPECVSFAPLSLGRGVAYLEKRGVGSFTEKNFKRFNFPTTFGSLYPLLKKEGYRNLAGHPRSYLALGGREKAMNLNSIGRWELNSIFGVGLSAASFLYFKTNNKNRGHLLEYVEVADSNKRSSLLNKKKLPLLYGFEFDEDELIRRYLIGQLAYWGKIRKEQFRQKIGREPLEIVRQKFPDLLKNSWLIDKPDALYMKDQQLLRNRKKFFLFCLEYIYSPEIIKQCKKYRQSG